MMMQRVERIQDLQRPGDYVLNDRCQCCDAHGRQLADGGGVLHHYSTCNVPGSKRGFILMCKCGALRASGRGHVVLTDEPLTIQPSWVCRAGNCHSWIQNGEWRDC
jgi:hypothetical protein